MSDEQGSGSDSPEDSFERIQREFDRTLEKHKHPRRSLKNLFPERENNKPRFRKSVIDRAVAQILKNKVVSSTPMPCGKKLNFTPDSSAIISPIDESKKTPQPPQNEPEIITVSSSNISQRNQSPDKDTSTANKSSRTLRSAAATSKQSIGTSPLNLVANTSSEKMVPVSKVKKSSIAVQTSKKSLDAPGPSGRKIARSLFSKTRGRQTQTTDSLKMNRRGDTPEATSSDSSSIHAIDDILAPVDETMTNRRFSEHLPAPWRCPSGTAAGLMNDFSNVTQGSVVLDSYERSPDEDETFRPQPPKKVKVFQNRKKTIAKIRPPDDGFENPPPVEDGNDFRSTDEDETPRPQPPKKGKVFKNRKKVTAVSDNVEIRPQDDISKNPPPVEDNNDFRSPDADETFRPQPPKKGKVSQNREKPMTVLHNVEIRPPDDGFKNPPLVEDSNGFETDDEQSEHEAPRKKSVQAGSARKNIDDIFEKRQEQHSFTNQNVDQVDNFVENANNADDGVEAAENNNVTLTNENVDLQESDGEMQKSTKKRSNRVVSSDNESLADDAKEVNDRPAKGKQVKKANNTKSAKKRKTAANSSKQNPNSTVIAQTTMPSILITEPSEGLRRSTRERKPVPPKVNGVVFVKTERALKIYNGTQSTSSLTLNRSSVSAKNLTTKNRNLASVCSPIHEEEEEAGPSTSKTKHRRISKRTTTTSHKNTETKTKSRRVSKKTATAQRNAAPTPPPPEIESRPNTPQSNRETGYGSGSGPDTNTEDLDTIYKYQDGKLCALKWSAHKANLVFKPMDGYENIDIGASLSQSQSWGLGILRIHPGATKPRQKPNKHNMAFTVLEGEALVTLDGKSIKHSASDLFFVYTGCEYSIQNMSETRPLELSFVRFVPANKVGR